MPLIPPPPGHCQDPFSPSHTYGAYLAKCSKYTNECANREGYDESLRANNRTLKKKLQKQRAKLRKALELEKERERKAALEAKDRDIIAALEARERENRAALRAKERDNRLALEAALGFGNAGCNFQRTFQATGLPRVREPRILSLAAAANPPSGRGPSLHRRRRLSMPLPRHSRALPGTEEIVT